MIPCMKEWAKANEPLKKPRTRNAPKVFTPVNDIESIAIKALQDVTFPAFTNAKRFARNIAGAVTMTDAQRNLLWATVYRFRRQIANKELVEFAEKQKEAKR